MIKDKFKKALTVGLICLTLYPTPYFIFPPFIQAAEYQQDLRVVILPFRNITRNAADNWLAESFSESLTMGLSQVSSLQLIERSQIQALMKEQAFSQSALADDSTAPQLGKILGAKVMVLGNYQKVGDMLVVNARFVDVETGKIDTTLMAQVEGSFGELFQLQKQLADRLVEGLKVSKTEQEEKRMDQILTATDSTLAYEYYIKGKNAALYGTDSKIIEAEDYFNKALKEDPNYPLAYAGLSEVYSNRVLLGNALSQSVEPDWIKKAMSYAQKAVQLAPELPEPHRALANAYAAIKDREAAMTSIQQALKIAPHHHENILAYLNIKYGDHWDFDQMKTDLNSMGADLNNPWIQFTLASALFSRAGEQPDADITPAIELLKKAHIGLPKYFYIPMMLGAAYMLKADFSESKKWLDKALELAPDNYINLYMAGSTALGMGETEKATELLKAAIKANPKYGYAHMTLGYLYLDKDSNLSLEYFKKAAQLLPKSAAVFQGVGYWHMKEGNYDKAIRSFQHALNLLGEMIEETPRGTILLSIARTYNRQENYAKALDYYQQLLKEPPAYHKEAYTGLSHVYSMQNSHEKALQTYVDFFKHFPEAAKEKEYQLEYREYYLLNRRDKEPNNPDILNDLGQNAVLKQAYDLANAYYQEGLSMAPDHPVLNYNLGYLLMQQQKWEMAQVALEKAVKLKADYTSAYFNLGVVYWQLQNKDLARQMWEKVVTLDPEHEKAKQMLSQF